MPKSLNVTVKTHESVSAPVDARVGVIIRPCSCGGDIEFVNECSYDTLGGQVSDAKSMREAPVTLNVPQGVFKIGVITGNDTEPSYWRHGVVVTPETDAAPLKEHIITLHY